MLGKDELKEAFVLLSGCCYDIWNWEIDTLFNVIHSDCPNESLYKDLFLIGKCQEAIEEHLILSVLPIICIAPNRLSWIIAFELLDNGDYAFYVKGPFFLGYNALANSPNFVNTLGISESAMDKLNDSLQKLPTLKVCEAMDYAVMLHYCLQQKKIDAQEIAYIELAYPYTLPKDVAANQFDKHGNKWAAEQEILYKIRNGDVNVDEAVERFLMPINTKVSSKGMDIDTYRQKVYQLLVLVSRAAVEGKLSQKTSYALSSDYRHTINRCRSIVELKLVLYDMLVDYARRVQKAKSYSVCSTQIRLCCEYIDTHPEEKLSLELLSHHTGYTKSHLSRKFNQEMNCSITEYVQRSKINRAKYLLKTTLITLEELSYMLGFGSRSYFSSVFKKNVGETPIDYHKEHGIV